MSTKKSINIIFPFRSYHNQKFRLNLVLFFLLPIVFNIIVLTNLALITEIWGSFLQYYLPKLQLTATVIYTQYNLFDFVFYLPSIDLFAELPDANIWWSSIVVTVTLFILSYFIPDSFTPLKYFLRVFIAILWITQLFFLLYPVSFIYTIRLYTTSGFLQIISLLFATPWLFAFTYYLFGFDLIKKVLITTLVLVYFVVLAPFQYLVNSVIIHYCSLMFMPVLYLFAGLLINIFSIIAFYALGVSLVYNLPKFRKKLN